MGHRSGLGGWTHAPTSRRDPGNELSPTSLPIISHLLSYSTELNLDLYGHCYPRNGLFTYLIRRYPRTSLACPGERLLSLVRKGCKFAVIRTEDRRSPAIESFHRTNARTKRNESNDCRHHETRRVCLDYPQLQLGPRRCLRRAWRAGPEMESRRDRRAGGEMGHRRKSILPILRLCG